MITEEKLQIFKAELCQECPDAPMDECRCGCMRKAIYNSLYEHAASEPPTNADRMRAMTDEELADSRVGELIGIAPCPLWIAIDVPERIVLSKQAAVEMELAWLQQPAKEEHHEDD